MLALSYVLGAPARNSSAAVASPSQHAAPSQQVAPSQQQAAPTQHAAPSQQAACTCGAHGVCVEDGACFCDAGYSGADCASAGCDDCAHGGSDERFWTAVSPSLGPLKSESVAAAGHGMWGAGSALLGLPAPRAMLPASPFGWWSHGAPTGMPLAPWGSGGV